MSKADENGWISVKDEIPSAKTEVLAFSEYKTIRQASWMEYTGQNQMWFESVFTHWQPLPKPPINQ